MHSSYLILQLLASWSDTMLHDDVIANVQKLSVAEQMSMQRAIDVVPDYYGNRSPYATESMRAAIVGTQVACC